MDAEQINALGGWCELVGVGFVARDLMSLARYREKPKEWADRFLTSRARVVAAVRRLVGLPSRHELHVRLDAVLSDAGGGSDTAMVVPGPLSPRPGQSIPEQIAELGLLTNRLRELVIREREEREQAIKGEREARREGLRAEAEHRERQITNVQEYLEELRERTTGDLGLKAESIVFLTVGILFTAWPEKFADWLPAWPPFPVAVLFVITWPLARYADATWLRPHKK